jgi:hypothetical protein
MMEDERLVQFPKEVNDQGSKVTSITGMFLLKVPTSRDISELVVSEVNSIDTSRSQTKKRRIIIRSISELEHIHKDTFEI